MSDEKGYECPYCGCQDRIGYMPDFGTRAEEEFLGVLYRKKDGTWRQEKETYMVLQGRHFCPQCGEWLPNSAVQDWEKEPREEIGCFQCPQASKKDEK